MRWIWIDKFLEFESGKRAVSLKNVTLAEEHLHDHFPGFPIMPECLMIEAMAQTAVVAFGIYLLSREKSEQEIAQFTTLFSDAKVEFYKPVLPGDTITVKAQKKFFRRMKLRAMAECFNQHGELVCQCELSGVGVKTA